MHYFPQKNYKPTFAPPSVKDMKLAGDLKGIINTHLCATNMNATELQKETKHIDGAIEKVFI